MGRCSFQVPCLDGCWVSKNAFVNGSETEAPNWGAAAGCCFVGSLDQLGERLWLGGCEAMDLPGLVQDIGSMTWR